MAIDDKTIPVPGTDIGRALDEAFRAMDKKQRPKVLVLLTDGEDLEKGGVRTAEALAKQGVVVFTVGVGTPAGAEIQILNEQGKPELVRDSNGEVVRSRLDETTLRAIAQATHGAYYPLVRWARAWPRSGSHWKPWTQAPAQPRRASWAWTASIGPWRGCWSCWWRNL